MKSHYSGYTKKLLQLTVLLIVGSVVGSCGTFSKNESAAPRNITEPARNVILFIGDGMGVSTVTAARIYDGQSRGGSGESNILPFERFPHVALVKTYNTNQQVPDSAGTASAMTTGVKTRAGVIGVGPDTHRGSCKEAKAHELRTIGEIARAGGKAVGVVTTARLTHATPAAVYAHSPERDWEANSNMPDAEHLEGCKDIAAQLIEFPFDIVLGGGRRNFVGSASGGRRSGDGDDLIADWRGQTGGAFVSTEVELDSAGNDQPVLGLFADSHMTYMLDKTSASTEPTLTQMTVAAIDHLSEGGDGFFLMVEGGRIDHGHHAGKAGYALSEAQEFSRAVAAGVEATNPDETLILVTADHSHVFTIAGYPTRGNPILGFAKGNDERGEPTGEAILAADGKPYTTLGYMNGPGAVEGARPTPDLGDKVIQQSLVPTFYKDGDRIIYSETHGGEDVALYATGPGAGRVHGVIEQNKIFDIMIGAYGWESPPSFDSTDSDRADARAQR